MTQRETLLLAYADGELEADEAQRVERLLDADLAAREQLEVYRNSAALLRAACAEAFYRGVPERSAVSLAEAKVCAARRTILAAAAALLLGIVGFGAGYEIGGLPPSPYQSLLDDIAEYHGIYARDAAHLVEVPASRRDEIEAWLGQSVGKKLTVPDLSGAGFEFAGGRLLVGNGRQIAQLLYTRPGTLPLGICVTALRDAPGQVQLAHRAGLSLAGWRQGAYTYVVVGDLGDAQMRSLAQRISAELRG